MDKEICVDVSLGSDARRILEEFIVKKKELGRIKDVRVESFVAHIVSVCGDKESMNVIRSTFASTISSLKNNTVGELENFLDSLIEVVD